MTVIRVREASTIEHNTMESYGAHREKVDLVNHPPHYRGPGIECIRVIRHIKDMRLANAMKYIWRVAFGGKGNDRQDIEKAMWYLKDWLEYPV